MVFDSLFERFAQSAPACVMHRALMENIFSPDKLDALFLKVAKRQYYRELLFSTLVDLTSQVVCRSAPSINAAYVRQRERISVTVRALYDKLDRVELGTSQALVQYVANQTRKLVDHCKGRREPLLRGYRTRILDGNHLGKSEHRLGVLRDTAAGALPGQTLVLLDPDRMIIDEVVCCEDGHAQERSLLPELLTKVVADDLLIDDRNFCTLWFLFALQRRKAYFLTRQHKTLPYKALEKPRSQGCSDTGRIYVQQIELCDPEIGQTTKIRRVTVKLCSPTRDGDSEIHLLTNLPVSVSAQKVAELYRNRWTLEQAFNELTTQLRCELNTLGYPKAALFAFCVAVCSYNLLAAVKGAMRGVHGDEAMTKVSNYYLTNEIASVYEGMMVAMPPNDWKVFQTMSLASLAAHLIRWARGADLSKYPKHPRGPKKPPPKRPNAQFQHVSTKRLLDEQRQDKKQPRLKASAANP